MPPGAARLERNRVGDLATRDVVAVPLGASLADAVDALLVHPENRAAYVVDAAGRVAGAVSYRSVLRAVNARLGASASGPLSLVRYWRDVAADRVERLMRPARPVREATPLVEALRAMEEGRENDLPVVDADGRLVAELRGVDVLRAAADVVRKGDDAVATERKG